MSLQRRRRQCTNAVITGLIIMSATSAADENYANVIIGGFLIVFIVVSRRWLDAIGRQERRQAAQEQLSSVRALCEQHQARQKL